MFISRANRPNKRRVSKLSILWHTPKLSS